MKANFITSFETVETVQAMVNALREAGLDISESESGFWLKFPGTKRDAFRAMIGERGDYLVRRDVRLFEETATA